MLRSLLVHRSIVALVLAPLLACAGGATSSPPVEQSSQSSGPASAGEQPIAPETTAEAPTGPLARVRTPATLAAHTATQEKILGEALADTPLVHDTAIEDPSGDALTAFHTALKAHETGDEDGRKLRIAMYGASSVAAERYTGYMRGYMQQRFGDGGIGFVALVPIWRWHRHNAVVVKASKHWAIEHAQRKTGLLDGNYGILGASAHTTNKRAWAELRGRSNALSLASNTELLEFLFLQQPDGGSFSVKSGKKVVATVATAADTAAPGYHALTVSDGWLPLRVEPAGDGQVRLFGAILERSQTGVVVDALGVGGTRAANIVDWTDSVWTHSLKRRDPALYVLAYGANESVDEDEPIATYRADLTTVLDKFSTALPDASCVLIGPVDFPRREEETEAWVARPRIDQIITAQREIAFAKGCGFFDSRKLTGGPGTMDDWATADPQLAKDDHLHLTTLGYLHFGRAFVDALMAGYDAEAAASVQG